ncbi:hypothetical protein C8N40_110141 [Pontibacter mucosus]|uniref:Clindamycin resistance transfer factor BtgB n=1 Tax=Pontibacter mucosus TaxID=1649266 RepID=A0A2T5YDT8_9BACT|nr:DUF5712 family protein [Pontibacter mucosus]PTX14712.1 hypothetical protein C8N40_110141 [Pontibacter mucosus]
MNIKILGGGTGTYANRGSSAALVNYLQHEDLERLREGQATEPFFDQERDRVSAREAIYRLDHNKGQLGKNDAKFYALIVSPSEKELRHLGETKEEQARALKAYVREEVLPAYAANFNKGLTAKDILYYGKVHHERDDEVGEQMHAHLIVSRKDVANKVKLSPMTNHRATGKGAVRGGFDREAFVSACEERFDRQTGYKREPQESFAYCRALKKGDVEAIRQQARERAALEAQRKQQEKQAEKMKQQQEQKQAQELGRRQNRGIRR